MPRQPPKDLASPDLATRPLPRVLARLGRVLGLDFHVLSTIALRSWAAFAGIVTVLMLSTRLTAFEQGYYFTFATLIALQVFFELGLNQVITQVVSHEAAHSHTAADGSLTGDERGAARIAGLIDLLRRWYRLAAVGFVLAVGAIGCALFAARGGLTMSEWLPVWAILVSTTALNLRLSPLLAVAEGLGHVGQVARLRLVQSVAGYALLWITLLAGGGLWAVAMVPIASALCTQVWLRRRFQHLADNDERDRISWRREIFPFQWRLSVSWVSGYFIFGLFTPVAFVRYGAIEAGRIGMALSVLASVTTISLSWVNAKAPIFAGMVTRGDRKALNGMWRRVALMSTLAAALTCGVLLAVVIWARAQDLAVGTRIAAPSLLTWLCVATVANVATYAFATYMRAHREEPLLLLSIVLALSITVCILTMPSATTTFAAYAGIVTLVGLPWTLVLFRRYYPRVRGAVSKSADV